MDFELKVARSVAKQVLAKHKDTPWVWDAVMAKAFLKRDEQAIERRELCMKLVNMNQMLESRIAELESPLHKRSSRASKVRAARGLDPDEEWDP